MTLRYQRRKQWPPGCAWCGQPLEQKPTGRLRRYCRHSCRQRAYEYRKVEQVHEWLEDREHELERIRFELAQLTEQLEPIAGGRVSGAPDCVRELSSQVLDVTDPYRRANRIGWHFPPRGRRPRRRSEPALR